MLVFNDSDNGTEAFGTMDPRKKTVYDRELILMIPTVSVERQDVEST